MRSVKIHWVKLTALIFLLMALTAVGTVWISSRSLYPHLLESILSRQVRDSVGVVGARFTQEEPIFPEEFRQESPPLRQTTNENNQTIMIRRPKGVDLDPKPVAWVGNISLSQLGLKELPASRPPACILLGFGKCGTSALLEFLDLHPKIVSLDWEPDYFCDRMYPKYDLQWYVKKMPASFSDQLTIEKSPCYIVEHDSHIRMHAMNSSLKLCMINSYEYSTAVRDEVVAVGRCDIGRKQIMVIIRDPITRLLSEYGHYAATENYWGRRAMTFEERVYNLRTQEFKVAQILKVGDYAPHFEHLLKVFPRNQVLILDGDKLVTDPLSQVRRVEDFLGLRHEITDNDIYFDQSKGFYCMKLPLTKETKCLGKSKGRVHVEIDPDFKRKLIDFFVPFNERFFKIVGQRFDWLK